MPYGRQDQVRSVSEVPRVAPAVRTTGSTGNTQGEMLVITPARNPTTIRVIMRTPEGDRLFPLRAYDAAPPMDCAAGGRGQMIVSSRHGEILRRAPGQPATPGDHPG